MSVYDFDISLNVKRYIATFLRKPKMRAWLFASLKPWYMLKIEFDDGSGLQTSFVGKINYRLSFSSQTLILQYLLQNELGNTSIKIGNINNAFAALFVGYLSEPNHSHFYGYYNEIGDQINLGYYKEMKQSETDFVIWIPLYFINVNNPTQPQLDLLNRLKAIVDKYKLSSRRYIVTNDSSLLPIDQ